jgi:transposase
MAGMLATLDAEFLTAFRAGTLTHEQAERCVPATDRAGFIFLLLQLSAVVATPVAGPHTPSGAVPPYAKENTRATPRNGKKRGGQPGHLGAARPQPRTIDRRETHQFPQCPCCGGDLTRTGNTRTRVIEDIIETAKTEAVEHTIHRDWCPTCRKQVEPKVPDALPNCTLGHRTVALTAWLYYGLGVTLAQIVQVFNVHLVLSITAGGLVQMWHRLADLFLPWYEQIHRHCLDAGVLHADETGWRVNGETWWLWCFASADATYYMLDRSRGHPALDKFFVEEFQGVLVSDFWAAYDAVGRLSQKCWPHLLRDLKEVHEGQENGDDWPEFYKRLRRVYGDAIRLEAARAETPPDAYGLRHAKLQGRLIDLALQGWRNPQAKRLAKRLAKYGEDLLTFVEFAGVPSSNNRAEREVRPAVQMRKTSYGNQSEQGAATRSVLMTIYRTLHRRGRDPLATIAAALRTYTTTGQLPPLPDKIASEG